MQGKIPEFLNKMLEEQYGKEVTNKIINGYENKRAVTLRINTIKTNASKIKEILDKEKITFKEVSWNENALIIENAVEEDIRKLEIYEKGEIYLQSLSSMIPPIILDPKEKENILDMAAAPGGKTTQMSALSGNKAMITACEKNKIRLERLKYNIEKQGAKGINIMQEDSRKLSEFFSFDKILLDAPCSGSGTIILEEKAKEKYFTEELIERSVKTQEEMLRKALKILKHGGELVYSTCSILKNENENLLNRVLEKEKANIVPITIETFKDIPTLPVTIEGTLCVQPTKLCEGFFVAKLKKE